MQKYTAIIIMVLVSSLTKAQQDPQFTQYMYNMSVINPAYATDNPGMLNMGGLYRSQWVGVTGAPQTGTFFAHMPLVKNVEVGLSFVHDEIGDIVKEDNIYADVAYVLPIADKTKLSFGVKGGVTLFNTNFNGFQYTDINPDPAFQNNLNRAFPNLGVGAYLFGDSYYFGFSAPNLLTSKHLERQDGVVTDAVEEIHYFATGGYVFDLNENLKFKPAFMAKGVAGAPLSVDLTANVLINRVFEAGLGYRFDDSLSALASFYISPTMRIGYSFDYTISNLTRFSSGSHEIMLLFDLDVLGKGFYKSPRFF